MTFEEQRAQFERHRALGMMNQSPLSDPMQDLNNQQRLLDDDHLKLSRQVGELRERFWIWFCIALASLTWNLILIFWR